MTTRSAHTRNPHDGGFDVATGQDVSAGDVIARVYWDDPGGDIGAGVVVKWHDGETQLPDSAAETVLMFLEHGYVLDASSIEDVRALARGASTS